MSRKTTVEILKDEIRDSGLSLCELSRRTDIVVPILSRFIKGERTLILATAQKLMDYFGLEITKRK
jgi:plasmid maintenance system antidote protein VapI